MKANPLFAVFSRLATSVVLPAIASGSHKICKALSVLLPIVLASQSMAIGAFSEQDWVSMGVTPTISGGSVNAMVVDDSGKVYIGGRFNMAGGVFVSNVAMWDGSVWHPLGSG